MLYQPGRHGPQAIFLGTILKREKREKRGDENLRNWVLTRGRKTEVSVRMIRVLPVIRQARTGGG